jgi:hypothetical protein
MSTFWPTTTISILRGTTVNAAGDTIDADTAVYTGVPASIMERSRQGIDQSTQDPRVYRYVTGRVLAGTDILDTDRVLDEKTNKKYSISDLRQLSSPVHVPDIGLDLKRVN